ncbi:2OG-Fe(II) oxygenase [Paucibacter sp. R3-3]|uniref:2OG-Fe(II) oxygenase n=1 Tax=Roseateles agri TaxID=3098619 RepID=A0ABU5DH58_9BURK|nr:2OG-Fe(II) oxygenase [Paucibacter sp. R3-3]MDY0745625.1 2OG-Fe(II) oxygenase [Paucibacter sp. R3-3]
MAVIHGRDALSESTLERLLQYLEERRKQPVWNTNINLWDQGIVHASAPVLVHPIEQSFSNDLLAELHARGKLPYLHQGETVMFYAWPPGSYIPWHSDFVDKYSMTVYLNREWNPDHGGAFCWQDWGVGIERHDWSGPPVQSQMIRPRHNAYALMTDTEWHCVTATTSNAPARLTLQLFLPRPAPPMAAPPKPGSSGASMASMGP